MSYEVVAAMRKETLERDLEELRNAQGPFHRFPFRFNGKEEFAEFDVFLEALVANRNITHVALYLNDYDGSQLDFVEAMKRPECAVTTVDVSGSRHLNLVWWNESCGSVKHLVARELDDSLHFPRTTHGWEECTLESMDLSRNWGIERDGVDCLLAMIRECPRLRRLDVSRSQLPKEARSELWDAANDRGEGFALVCERTGEGLMRRD